MVCCGGAELRAIVGAFQRLMPGASVEKVLRNDNPKRYETYRAQRALVKSQNRGVANEQWLFNGNDSVLENLENGFMTQFASQVTR